MKYSVKIEYEVRDDGMIPVSSIKNRAIGSVRVEGLASHQNFVSMDRSWRVVVEDRSPIGEVS